MVHNLVSREASALRLMAREIGGEDPNPNFKTTSTYFERSFQQLESIQGLGRENQKLRIQVRAGPISSTNESLNGPNEIVSEDDIGRRVNALNKPMDRAFSALTIAQILASPAISPSERAILSKNKFIVAFKDQKIEAALDAKAEGRATP